MKIVKAFIERGKDGTYSVYVDLKDKTLNYGIHGNGNTAENAKNDFYSAYEAMKEFHKIKGRKFVEARFEFHFDVVSFLSYFVGRFSLAGLEKITGINQRQLSHYLNGVNVPSARTVKKIDDALHRFADELSQVHLS